MSSVSESSVRPIEKGRVGVRVSRSRCLWHSEPRGECRTVLFVAGGWLEAGRWLGMVQVKVVFVGAGFVAW